MNLGVTYSKQVKVSSQGNKLAVYRFYMVTENSEMQTVQNNSQGAKIQGAAGFDMNMKAGQAGAASEQAQSITLAQYIQMLERQKLIDVKQLSN